MGDFLSRSLDWFASHDTQTGHVAALAHQHLGGAQAILCLTKHELLDDAVF
jgi:hypothetical protein